MQCINGLLFFYPLASMRVMHKAKYFTLLSLGRSYGRLFSMVAMVILPWNPSCLKVSAHAMEAAPVKVYNTLVKQSSQGKGLWEGTYHECLAC